MLEPERPEAVWPDRALSLSNFSHFLIVSKLFSLSLALTRACFHWFSIYAVAGFGLPMCLVTERSETTPVCRPRRSLKVAASPPNFARAGYSLNSPISGGPHEVSPNLGISASNRQHGAARIVEPIYRLPNFLAQRFSSWKSNILLQDTPARDIVGGFDALMIADAVDAASHVEAACDGAESMHVALDASADLAPLHSSTPVDLLLRQICVRNGCRRLPACHREISADVEARVHHRSRAYNAVDVAHRVPSFRLSPPTPHIPQKQIAGVGDRAHCKQRMPGTAHPRPHSQSKNVAGLETGPQRLPAPRSVVVDGNVGSLHVTNHAKAPGNVQEIVRGCIDPMLALPSDSNARHGPLHYGAARQAPSLAVPQAQPTACKALAPCALLLLTGMRHMLVAARM